MAFLARRRVALGFICGIAALVLARPTRDTLLVGALIAAAGEAIRIWAAGHLEKSREVTTSGPYRFTRHPLYVGSAVITLGFVIASRSWLVALLAAVYLALTYTAAIRREEAFLTEQFGAAYPDYRAGRLGGVARTFSLERAMRNREYRSVGGILAAIAVLAVKMVIR
ncbi:MAG TPA: isoprenylcysteine carboxylmethyltransferase family protein [Vicinamibacterales bacterium]|nr:isoprenylcysteine carboxylmethyltransferase family protein [Vicinamibacterales bacterium]